MRPPVEVLAEKHWLEHFIVTSVRHPIDRFFSGYYGNVREPERRALEARYGPAFKSLTPKEYFEVIQQHPRHVGLQTQWTDFPCLEKPPRADLVLRLEDVGQWVDIMRGAGVELSMQSMPHEGKTKNKPKRDLEDLGLTQADYDALCDRIETIYAADYKAFGYQPGSGR